MIIADTRPPAGAPATAPSRWTSLARRGMLWSEVQVFDTFTLAAGASGPATDPHYIDLLYCATGSLTVESQQAGAGEVLRVRAGQCLVLSPERAARHLVAGSDGAMLLRVRALPVETSQRLPARQPSLQRPGLPHPPL